MNENRQHGLEDRAIVVTTTLIEWSWFNPHPGHIVASLHKTLYNDYLCLVASNKQQIQWTRIRRNPQKTLDHWKHFSRCGFLQSQSSHCNEKCEDRPISCCLMLPGDRRINMRYNNNKYIMLQNLPKLCLVQIFFPLLLFHL